MILPTKAEVLNQHSISALRLGYETKAKGPQGIRSSSNRGRVNLIQLRKADAALEVTIHLCHRMTRKRDQRAIVSHRRSGAFFLTQAVTLYNKINRLMKSFRLFSLFFLCIRYQV